MPNVICDFTACTYNMACECTRPGEIRISEGYCMDSEDCGSTGEVVEEEEHEDIH